MSLRFSPKADKYLKTAKNNNSAFTKERVTKDELIELEKMNKNVMDINHLSLKDTDLLIMRWHRECFDKPLIHKGRAKKKSKKEVRTVDYRSGYFVGKKFDNSIDYTQDDLIGLSLWFITNSCKPDVDVFLERIVEPCIRIIKDKDTPDSVKYAPFRWIVAKYVCKVLENYYSGVYDGYDEPYSDPLGMYPDSILLESLLTEEDVEQYPLSYRAEESMRVNWEQSNGFNYITLQGDRYGDKITPPPKNTLKLQKGVLLQGIGVQ